jgi:hypothetical protein
LFRLPLYHKRAALDGPLTLLLLYELPSPEYFPSILVQVPLKIRPAALGWIPLIQQLRGYVILHLAAPMAMLGDGLDELRRHIVYPSVTADKDTFVYNYLIAFGVRLGDRLHAKI